MNKRSCALLVINIVIICKGIHRKTCFEIFLRYFVFFQMAEGSITNLNPLRARIEELDLPLEVGPVTRKDGSCFVGSIQQNMEQLRTEGLWKNVIPDDVEDIRAKIIHFMEENRGIWTRERYNEVLKVWQHPPYTDEQFDALLEDQRRPRAWTDNNGTMVEACCLCYEFQLNILIPTIEGPILPSGLGGPLQIINKSVSNTRPVFFVGLLKDSRGEDGHYQFLRKKQNPIEQNSSMSSVLSPTRVRSPTFSPSPIKFRRSRLISKYLKSPQPKRHQKEDHCHFCNVSVQGIDLEIHLNQSADCARYYQRNFKIKSIMAIVVKEFPCLFCSSTGKNWRITNHLKKNGSCLKKYLEKFKVSNLKELQKRLELLRKQSRPSVVNRKLEWQKARSKLDDENERKTEIDLLNEYRRNTSFGNILLCVRCGANFCQSSNRINVIELGDDEAKDEEMQLKRRLEKYHQCQDCIKEGEDSGNRFVRLENESQVLFMPVRSDMEVIENSDNNENVEVNKNITCLLPCSIECLESTRAKYSKQDGPGIIYKLNVPYSKLFTIIYNSEWSKYQNLKLFSDRYEGSVSEGNARTLNQAERVVNDASIVASDAWTRINILNITHRLEQLGAVCCFINIKVEIDSEDVIASCLVLQGLVVTVEFIGDSTNEMTTNYLVHTNHKADQDCSSSCIKIALTEYLQNSGFDKSSIKTKYLSAYISSVQQKFNGLLKSFVKGNQSSLHSEQFFFQLYFSLDNSVFIRGLTWPEYLNYFNTEIGLGKTSFMAEKKEDVLKKTEAVTLATSHEETLSTCLNLSKEKANLLSKQILKHQIHDCDHEKSLDCSFPRLPLLESMVIEWSPNLQTCLEFNKLIRSILKQMDNDKLKSLTTRQWLIELFTSGMWIGDIINDQVFNVRAGAQIFEFIIDDRMIELFSKYVQEFKGYNSPLIALYHYSASVGSSKEIGGIVSKRPMMTDIYILDFNPTILKAFGSLCEVSIRNGFEDSVQAQLQHTNRRLHWSTNLELDEKISSSHREVSLAEAFTLYDKKFFRSNTSNPVEFIAAVEKRKKFFKKVRSPTDKSFLVPRTGLILEEQLTNVERYFIRCTTVKITLSEFVLLYDFCGTKESQNFYKLFGLQGVEIQDSEFNCVSSKEPLPEFIILKNHDVMKIRTKRKILSFPRCEADTQEHIYQQVLLFSPGAKETMNEREVLKLYWEKDDPPRFNDDGDMMTVVRRVRRYVNHYSKKIYIHLMLPGSCFQNSSGIERL